MSPVAATATSGWRAVFKAALEAENAGDVNGAIRRLNEALRLAPRQSAVYRQLGVLLHRQERWEAALANFRRALEEAPDTPVQWSNIGITLRDMGRFDEAADAFARAASMAPDNAKYAFRHGYALLKAMRPVEAAAALERAAAFPDAEDEAELSHALALLTAGDLERGWPAYEARWRHKSSIKEPFPEKRWDGRPFDGTLLVVAEQGLGDAIQFVRFAAMARARCRRLVFQGPKGSESLMATAHGVDEVIPRGATPPPFDAAIGLLSLPRVFGTTLDTIPAQVPYLHPAPEACEAARRAFSQLGKLRRVGIVWAGNPKHAEDRRRSIPFLKFLELLAVPGIALLSLQKGERVREAAESGAASLVSDLQKRMDTLADTAALISAMDLVITCDTAMAHLAGALGKPVWILLARTVDWRWLCDREVSPWYPTARLFRQETPDDWDGVFRRVVAALRESA